MVTVKKRPSLKPRKIPQQSRAEQTVATILEAAARILETQGLQGLNTNLVALRAGVSIGSLYQYFPGKDALIVALIQRERGLFLAEGESALGEPTGRQALTHLIAVAVRQQLRRPILARLLDFEEDRPPIAKELRQSTAAFRELIRQILTRGDLPPQPAIARLGLENAHLSVRSGNDAQLTELEEKNAAEGTAQVLIAGDS
ncbi:TetR/AcrR family transcriptional regulator [Dickeya chrysanthemi]|uniref:TetR/AcrR family transcriptional regulator n=1 Tax=Dickeya chrysanthemi TaxID=556 RepID=A0ABU8JN33_DICCH|nr:TetR/AcrR family transcriptional regulator [Dickeya chrysanthemi]MBX9445441.1 TetR/AcrR family transcriptional regulator [Dickeya chrysanthemi]MCA7008340.1 TetR/AcrR family transcriptional regulator [Dickeya chrysanthemi]